MALHLQITGRVQGVGYRAAFERQAISLGLSGWVRNRHDGSVEAVVDGDTGALAQIEAWARRGPAGASVQQVLATPCDAGSVRAGVMEIRPTA
ncbi:acylphosphatase [Noviherbaspirillum soli]|uniref:acylphosphatase n=1 Tax=Noviherbaspirillum soli TaxID=1064518 RepID=UPI00188D3D56|nr:acylphosphatase [Noviherbaspirillum soli]